MAPIFGRSISFPLTPGRSSSKPRHVRSISLPACTASSCHPLLAHLNAQIAAVLSSTDSTLAARLTHIHALHSSIVDLLLLPQMQNLLCSGVAAERLLDVFLLLADAHQGFQESFIELKHATAECSTALRRGDAARVASATRSQHRAEKDLARLAASVASKCVRLNHVATRGEDAEMVGALMEAAAASVVASAALFTAAGLMLSTASSCKKTTVFGSFVRKTVVPETAEVTVERLQAVVQCFDECDGVSDKVFRSIVQTRVSLLNIMTPTI